MSDLTFISLCLTGKLQPIDIDDFVEVWHTGAFKKEVWEFLGLTLEEYRHWVERPGSIKDIMEQRQNA